MKKSVTYSVVLPTEMITYIQAKATANDQSASAVVRKLVKDDMEKEKRNGL